MACSSFLLNALKCIEWVIGAVSIKHLRVLSVNDVSVCIVSLYDILCMTIGVVLINYVKILELFIKCLGTFGYAFVNYVKIVAMFLKYLGIFGDVFINCVEIIIVVC